MPRITLGKLELYYEIHGRGEPLLLIHGLGSSARDWELQIPDFSRRFQVIAIDLRGHGCSDKPPGPYNIALFAEDTARLIKKLATGPVHVLGISLGGMVAFQLALDHPRLVRSLIVVNSTPSMVPRSLWDRLIFFQRLLIVRFWGMRKMGQVLAGRFFPNPDQEKLREVFIQRWQENHQSAYLAALRATAGWSVRDRLGEIQAPALVLGADGDYFPLQDKVAYTGLMPHAELVIIKDSRHALPAEKPAEFNQAVLGFLADLA